MRSGQGSHARRQHKFMLTTDALCNTEEDPQRELRRRVSLLPLPWDAFPGIPDLVTDTGFGLCLSTSRSRVKDGKGALLLWEMRED